MPAPPIQQVFDDPDFWDNSKLDDTNRHKVLSTIDPDYARLPTVDRNTVLGTMRKRYEAKVSPALTDAPKVPLPAGLAAMSPREAREQPVAPAFRQPTNPELNESLEQTGNMMTGGSPSGVRKFEAGIKNLASYRNNPKAVNWKKGVADIGEGAMELAGNAGPFSAPAKAVAATAARTIGATAGLGAGVGAGMAVPKLNEAAAQRIGMRIQKPLDPDEERLAALGAGAVAGGLAHAAAPRMVEAVRTAPLQTLPKISPELTPTKLAPITPDTPQDQLSVIPPERRLAAPAIQMPGTEPPPVPVAQQAKQVGTKITMQDEMAQPGTQMPMPMVEPNEIHGPTPTGEVPVTAPQWEPTKSTVTPGAGEQMQLPAGESGGPVQPPFDRAAWTSSMKSRLTEINKRLTDKTLSSDDRKQLTAEKRALTKSIKELPAASPGETGLPTGQTELPFSDVDTHTIPETSIIEPEVPTPTVTAQQGTLWTSGEIPQTKVTTTPIFSSESGAPVAPLAQPELPPAPPAKPKSPITNPPPTLERQIRQLDQQLADPNLQPPQRRKLLEQRQQLAKQSVELAGFTPVRNLEATVSPSRPEATTLAKRYLELEAQLSPDSPDAARITPQARQLAEAAMSDIRTALGPEAIEQVRQGKNIGKWQEAGLREGMRTMADVRAGKVAAKESAIASGAAPPSGPPSAAQTLEDLFTPAEKPGIIESTIKSVDALYHKYIFRGRLPKAPWANRVVNDLRKVKDALVDAGQFSNNKLKEVAEPIYNSTTDKAERAAKVDQLERIINLQAWIDGYKRKSQTLPAADQIPLEAFENALADLKSTAPPEVLESVRRHDALGKELGQMLADRGKMPQEIVDDPYFPRFYEEWASNKQTEDLYRKKMKSMKLDVPERLYTKEKLGSELKPETNYFDVMDRHIKQIMLDNAMDDTVAKIVNENDQWTKLSKADRTYLHQQWGGAEPTPGTTYRLSDGTHLKAWASKVPPELATGTPLGDAVVQSLGTDSRRISLLKPELADHLDQFRTPRVPNSVLAYINKATSQWKRGVLGYSGLKFITKQIPDNYLVAYREHDLIQTISKSKEAWDILTGKYDGDTPFTMTEDRLRKIRLLREQRVFSGPSSVFSGELSGHHANLPTELSELRGENQFFRKVAYMANIMESIGDQHVRVAKFLADLERIDRGERPQTTTVDVSGLDPIDAAGKISREAFIDNGAKSDMFQQQISGFAMPFVWWAAKSIPQWGRYFTNPENYRTIDNPALRFGVPYALMQVWNNTVTKDVEKLHSDWYRTLPHLNTTYTTKDGYPVSVSLDTGAGVLMRFIGADRAGMLLSKIHSGEISPDDALSELATAAPRGMGGIAWAQLNPMLKLTFDLVAGRNLETGRKIVSDQDSADLQNEKRLKYAVGSAIAPAGKLMREAAKPPDISWGQESLPAAARPYIGGAGAMVAAPFDVYSAFAHEQDPNQAARSKYFDTLHTATDRAREQDEKVAGPYLDALAAAYANHYDPARDIPGIGNLQLQDALAKASGKLREEVARQNRIIEAANAQNPSTQKLPLVTSDQIKRYATSPAAMRQVVKRAIVMASSPERKKALQTFADALVHKADVEQFKGLSPGVQKVVPVPPAPIVRVP